MSGEPFALHRTKSLSLTPSEDGALRFVSSLMDVAVRVTDNRVVDELHDIQITGFVDRDSLLLSEVTPSAVTLPYGECRVAMALVSTLDDVCLDGGYRRRVIDLMGRTRGCSHFMTLALELSQLQTLVTYHKLRTAMPDIDRADPMWLAAAPSLENACYSLRTGSEALGGGGPADDPERE